MEFYILPVSFFFIALIYSSVGFGGGSSYLALLSQPLFALATDQLKATALLCNIVVVAGSSYVFIKERKISLREAWPFLLTSVPLAALGAFYKLDDRTFFIVLAFTLIAASVPLWIQHQPVKSNSDFNFNKAKKMSLGGPIGFLSGLVGIGGGIFLSPVLHFLNWADSRKIAALCSVFILANSMSGLAGLAIRGFPELEWQFIIPLLAAVMVGGQIGSRLGAIKFKLLYIRRITAALIFIAGLNILKDHWW